MEASLPQHEHDTHAPAPPSPAVRHPPAPQGLGRPWTGPCETLAQLFEGQVQRTPEGVAVLHGGQALTYRELNERANALAHRLIAAGVGPETLVGLWADRSVAMLTGLLAITKAGGAYLPLDPNYPSERLQQMLEDARPVLILGDAQTLATPIPRWTLDLEAPAEASNPRTALRPHHAAYVIYTSGSTGVPKGVVVTHAGLSALAAGHVERLGITAQSRVLQFASLCFDPSVVEMVSAFSCGATLVLVPPERMLGAALASLLTQHQVTHALLTPTVLATLEPQDCPSLRCLVVGGEVCPERLIERWAGRTQMHNAYGPTEATVCATLSAPLSPGAPVPLGPPLAGTLVYVLDPALEPVPTEAVGELYIAGIGLARGYLKRPGLTAERFLADPHGEPGTRMYRTGDRVRLCADGSLAYVGRTDGQVKLRGQRIELGEVESALCSQPGIRQAAVLLREEEGEKHLAAYVVADTFEEAGLRTQLARQLPRYMVPTAFVRLDALPLTPNGKLDRRALPAPTRTALHEPPQTPAEQQLAAIWCEVLGRSQISRQDDFFHLGGHSLRAQQVLSRVREVFQVALSLKTVFEASRLMECAAHIEAARAGESPQSLAIPTRGPEDTSPAPLSHSQERLWLVQSLEPEATAYNVSDTLRLRGALDLKALSDSVDDLFRRHEILRTVIRLESDTHCQIVEPWHPGHLQVVDLREHPDPGSEAQRLVEAGARERFDLSAAPVMRIRLLRITPQESLLTLVFHHVSGDQWSVGVFLRELAQLYSQRRRGAPPCLPALPVSYRDFARWQRSEAFTARLAPQLQHWKARLEGVAPLSLPTDHPRPKIWTSKGTNCTRPIPPHLLEALEARARSGGGTIFMTLLAGLVALLHRLSGQTDIAVGVPVANRIRSDLEGLLGVFINTLVLRVDAQGDPAFQDLAIRARDAALDAFAHPDVPFNLLVQEMGTRIDRSRPPLIQVMLNVTNAPMTGIDFDGLTWQRLPVEGAGAQLELSFYVDTEVTRTLRVEYNTDLYVQGTIERLIEQYWTLLEAALQLPTTRITALPVLPAAHHALLDHWNATDTPLPPEATFPRLFAQQAARTPQAVALTFEGQSLTYGELHTQATRLACRLVAAGAQRGTVVGVCLPRSPELLVSLLAVQHSGAAYLPLDPELPPERLLYMLNDSGCRLLLTPGILPRGMVLPAQITALNIATDSPGAELPTGPAPQDPVYILYTSGSTGRPKGVTVSHGALAAFLLAMQQHPGMQPSDVIAALTTISFDIAGLELYLPLIVGARIQLVPRHVAVDGLALAELLEEAGVTLLQATPATWRLLLEAGWRGKASLRALCGGEALPRRLADELLDRVAELWNLYGPTETTIWSTFEQVPRGEAAISIGRPIANTRVYLLDSAGALAPLGAVGEICIGGAGVAEGYHGRAGLTAERFIPDPFTTRPGARLYRTGDLGRWGADGKLYHLGRSDHQVKVRGMRIELGEIEQILTSHPAIAQAVAVVREAAPDDPRLIAYVTYRSDALPLGEIKRFLRVHLPDYMIPSMVITVMTIPLTPSGKVDRAALPDPFYTGSDASAPDQEPVTSMEKRLAAIWKAVLQVPKVGALDNFYELGGHSLLSLRVVRQVKEETGRSMDPRALFFHTLRDLARMLESPPGG